MPARSLAEKEVQPVRSDRVEDEPLEASRERGALSNTCIVQRLPVLKGGGAGGADSNRPPWPLCAGADAEGSPYEPGASCVASPGAGNIQFDDMITDLTRLPTDGRRSHDRPAPDPRFTARRTPESRHHPDRATLVREDDPGAVGVLRTPLYLAGGARHTRPRPLRPPRGPVSRRPGDPRRNTAGAQASVVCAGTRG